jgi:F0F1-type ATP synthase epsilon subunit
MELHIVSPKQHRAIQIQWIELHTPIGSMIIQKNHEPMVVSLVPGKPLTFVTNDETVESIPIEMGIVEITRKIVTLILHEE